jgi:SAM-dependent methyltransferase
MTRLQWFWKRIAASNKYRGVAFTILWCTMYAIRMAHTKWFIGYRARQFDRKYGLDTAEIIYPSALGIAALDAEQSVEYEACTPEMLAGALSNLSIQFQDYVFVDLGSGKGVAVLSASLFPFKHIVGIEWSQRVARIARENARKFTHPQQVCRSIELLDGDATTYELPYEPLVIFMYNPFKEPLVRRFVDNLRRSLEQRPRHVVIVYCNPRCKQVFEEAGFLQKVEVADDRAPVATYQSIVVAPERAADFRQTKSRSVAS